MPRPITGHAPVAQSCCYRAPVMRHTAAHAARRSHSIKQTPYTVPKEVINEIVQNRLMIGGKINMPTIEAPYGLYFDGVRVGPSGFACAYNFNKKVFISTKGVELSAPHLLEEFNSHRDFYKLMACREAIQSWENEEIETGKFGPFLANSAVTRAKLKEFSALSESLQKDIRFYAKILNIAHRFLKMCKEEGVVHTEHLPARIYTEGPSIPHPEKISKGHAVFIKDSRNLPEAVLTELGFFNISKLAGLNDPEKIKNLAFRFYSEFNVVDINSMLSFSTQYDFMGQGEVKVNHRLTNEASMEYSSLIRRWFEMRDYVFLLHNL